MVSLPLVLRTLVQSAHTLYQQPNQQWIQDKLEGDDLETLKKEALEESQFDPLKLRETLWNQVVSGEAKIVTRSCVNAKVIYIKNKRGLEPPWELWGRLVQWLGPSTGTKWRIFWFPAHNKRILPPLDQEVGPVHLNGGYTFPCKSDSIVVYRFEEATRVLLHEILHAACLDPPHADLPLREATTETWAELFLIALCSAGSETKAAELWAIQSQWIANQNHTLKIKYGVQTSEQYAWRYTVGRELILRSLKIDLPEGKFTRSASSRLTSPQLCA